MEQKQNDRSIKKEQFIKASVEHVFKTLTEKEELERWFVQKADIELQPGGAIRLEWAPGVFESGKILEIEPSHLISYSWEKFSPTPTTVTFALTSENDGTMLHFTHRGIGHGEDWDNYYANVNKGWDIHLKNLTDLLETGVCNPPGPSNKE